jgi:uncharacterized protein with von Willebrand factor type A (vWA) domain
MDRRILGLGRALREAGVPVATPEIVDASSAALAVGVGRRDDLRRALGAALIKRGEHRAIFDALFERLFPATLPAPPPRRQRGAAGDAGTGATGTTGAAGTTGATGAAAGQPSGRGLEAPAPPAAGEGEGERGTDAGRDSDGERLPAAADGDAGEDGAQVGAPALDPPGGQPPGTGPGEARYGECRAETERRRLLAKGFRERWSVQEQREAVAAMEELAARLVTRRARRRRRARRGSLDLAGTLRANLAHGGVPFLLRRRERIVGRRDLVLLADVSGSVRHCAALFLQVLGRIRSRFSGVRAFAYVDRPAEIPAALALAAPTAIAAALADALPLEALSDHGETFRRFNRDFAGALSGRSIVVILGDARNNRLPAQAGELEAIRRRCRRVIWIVPEPPSLWNGGDSALAAYAPHCDRVVAAPHPGALAAAALALASLR